MSDQQQTLPIPSLTPETRYFVDVVLPLPLRNRFSYRINREEAKFLKPGMRVAVPFGKSKIYTSLVHSVHATPPVGYETKEIFQILDETPIIQPQQLKHWEWMAEYYMCSLGEVMRAALSKSFLLESETLVARNKETDPQEMTLTEDEQEVCETLDRRSSMTVQEIGLLLDKVRVLPLVYGMVEKGLVSVKEEMVDVYKPKWIRYIKISEQYQSDQALQSVLESLKSAPKQTEVILSYYTLASQTKKPVKFSDLQKASRASYASINALLDKQILEDYHIQVDRIEYEGDSAESLKELSPHQETALGQIHQCFDSQMTTLLYGVTSSGKTEVYTRLIADYLERGRQVLYIVPEIALTTQLISRLQQYFGDNISVYHSKHTHNERMEVWYNVLHNKPKAQLVIGARSAQFLPFANLGLVVVDEEHEASFKQYNPAPRYHARDSALVLAHLHKAKVLLGSATPSLESWYNAANNKYGLVRLTERYGQVKMPHIRLVNLKESRMKKQMTGHFSKQLLEAMQQTLEAGEQVILFQNRRGFAPVLECQTCGHAPQCPNCDVSLTFHRHRNQLRCHYCGYAMAKTVACMACGSPELDYKGLGTEQVEGELKMLFPSKNIVRMDQDTTRGKHAYSQMIADVEQGETDILVGTQMVAKGLNFKKVGLVGVVMADSLFNFPDFRANERAFQLLTQVAGRAGRVQKQGRVWIQAYNTQHPVLEQVLRYDYEAMSQSQLDERRAFQYPPYYRLVRITFKARKINTLQTASHWYGKALRNVFGDTVLGPETPPIGRIKNEYLMHLVLKIPQGQSLSKSKERILKINRSFAAVKDFRPVKVVLDVDAY